MAKKHGSKTPPKSRGDYVLLRLEADFRKSKQMRQPAMRAMTSTFIGRAREYDKTHSPNQPDQRTDVTPATQSAENEVARLFDFDNLQMRGMWAAAVLRLDPNDPEDRTMLQAFEASGLDPNNPFDWVELLRLYSDAFLGEHGPGRNEEWLATRFEGLRSDFEHMQSKHRDVDDDEQICALLLRTEPYKSKYKDISNAEYLLKKVREARKPENNYHLKHPEMPLGERVLREHAERLGYDWSKWGSMLTEYWKACASEKAESVSEELATRLMNAGPNPAALSKGADGSDSRIQIIRGYYEELGWPWTRESESKGMKTLAPIDQEWSKFCKDRVSA
jgi:hypothetical protein